MNAIFEAFVEASKIPSDIKDQTVTIGQNRPKDMANTQPFKV
jgi:hypothetical protein